MNHVLRTISAIMTTGKKNKTPVQSAKFLSTSLDLGLMGKGKGSPPFLNRLMSGRTNRGGALGHMSLHPPDISACC